MRGASGLPPPTLALDFKFTQPCTEIADIGRMDITNSTIVDAAISNASNGTIGNAAGLSVLRKARAAQASGAAGLLTALPHTPAPATEGKLGRNVNTPA